MSNRMDTIWSQLDRKSTAIAEFTLDNIGRESQLG